MPKYQYHCTSCGRDLEIRQSFSDPSLTECPECTGSLRKVFNAVGVVFKGSGFYKTDSRTGSASIPARTASDSATSAAASAAASTSTSTTSAATPTPVTSGAVAG
ncbi:putative regulatory protein, FmdB family [Raineyella antarctica]|uniref:Putative regulatory protein, FmdB family n=1 Tax=Raineyella antarctica TaxID=1577474 RepID=A0A1G6GEF4_9ACTN|nr:FmdB family zinc ribbon protein [Raineyella antarctica]SDB80344.1 putative regulatory protein, FmdB family [Raineyella antarctica]